jgi:phospholipid/cholesterol/gamma-HCH transport system substrate-binding protein
MTRELRVGFFVVFGLALMALAVFLIGDTRDLWEAKQVYRTAFHNVGGLKSGAPVRMGGVDVGEVSFVGHMDNAADTRVLVKMAIAKRDAKGIHVDTVATIANKGLLGDKMIELTVAPPDSPVLPSTTLIPSEEPADVLAAANRIVSASVQAIEDIEPLAKALGDPKLAADIKGSAADLRAMLDAIVSGDGTMHRLFFDHRAADELDQVLNNLNRVSGRVDAALADVDDVTAHVRQGPGIAHALVYDGEISKNTAGTLQELHEDLKAIREGNGIAHALLFGDDPSQHAMANLNAMSDDLRAIIAGVRQGKGTLGALLVDPSVYEDIKSLVGNVERNEVLRALVRYSIKADEEHPAAKASATRP